MSGNCSFPQKMRMKWIGLEKVFAIQSAINDRSYSYFILYLTLKELDTLQIQGGIHLHPTLRAGCVYHLSRTTMGVFRAGLKPNGPSGVTENSIGTVSPKPALSGFYLAAEKLSPIYITRYFLEAYRNSNRLYFYQIDNSVC